MISGIPSIPQHFKQSGYYTAGGGKVYHHPPGFNRHSDRHEYFDQVFNGHYQARLARGEDVKNFAFPDGYPLNGIPEVKASPDRHATPRSSTGGHWTYRITRWATGRWSSGPRSFSRTRPRSRFSSPRASTGPICRGTHRVNFDMFPPDKITPPPIKEDDLDDIPEAGLVIAEQRRGDLELVRRGQYQRSCKRIWPASRSATSWSDGCWMPSMPVRRRRTRSSSSGPTTAGILARSSICTR